MIAAYGRCYTHLPIREGGIAFYSTARYDKVVVVLAPTKWALI